MQETLPRNDPPGDDEVIAIVCSDLHVSHRVPLFRTAEPDWYAAMDRPLSELRELSQQYKAPVILAGDLVDSPRQPPELVNWLMTKLPDKVYAVPGQHDLMHHTYEDIRKVTYWTLVESGRVVNLAPNKPERIRGAILRGFPWGHDILPPDNNPSPWGINVAVIHKYVWVAGYCYPGAPEDSRLKNLKNILDKYDACVIGDNHKGWMSANSRGGNILNCGSMMRRKSDEIDYKPAVGLLYGNGKIKRHYLNVGKDRYLKPDEMLERSTETLREMASFIHELEGLGNSSLDFREALIAYMKSKDIGEGVAAVVMRALDGNQI